MIIVGEQEQYREQWENDNETVRGWEENWNTIEEAIENCIWAELKQRRAGGRKEDLKNDDKNNR